jgi:hypothetical protein
MKSFGRVSVCGSISSYNTNPKNLPKGINYSSILYINVAYFISHYYKILHLIIIVYHFKDKNYFFSANAATSHSF